MTSSAYCATIFLLLLVSIAAFGELPPYVYKEQQEKAAEALVIKVQSVRSVETQLPNEKESAVTIVAQVEKVERTKSDLKAGDTIYIRYTRHHRDQLLAGPSELPILSQNQTYPAFLHQDGEKNGYVPSAGGRSFERMR